MKYAFNDNGVLKDVVMSAPSMLFPAWYAEQFIEVPDEAQNGWLWDGETANEPPVETPIPDSITPRQARILLAMQPATNGTSPHLLAQVEGLLGALPEPQRTIAQISWEYATAIQRTDPLISQVQSMLGLTDEQVGAMFAQAATL